VCGIKAIFYHHTPSPAQPLSIGTCVAFIFAIVSERQIFFWREMFSSPQLELHCSLIKRGNYTAAAIKLPGACFLFEYFSSSHVFYHPRTQQQE
jgi:hypothetical protein